MRKGRFKKKVRNFPHFKPTHPTCKVREINKNNMGKKIIFSHWKSRKYFKKFQDLADLAAIWISEIF